MLSCIESYKLELDHHISAEESINVNHYYCKITIRRLDKIGPVTAGHIKK